MYNKYIRTLGYKPYHNFKVTPHRIKNFFKHIYQRLTCGGCCSEDCWSLDSYSIEQLYTLLNIYLYDADKFIVLDDPMIQFDWEGRKISQKEAIIYIIASLGGFLEYSYNVGSIDFELEAAWYKQAQKALHLYAEIVHSCWW